MSERSAAGPENVSTPVDSWRAPWIGESKPSTDEGPRFGPGLENRGAISATSLHLVGGKRLVRNTLWNLAGNLAPLLVALFCIPPLVRALGTSRFGILTLVWALIGYAAIFDFGLGRALTQLVATKLGSNAREDVPGLVWTSQLMMLCLGFCGTVALIVSSSWLVRHALHVPVDLQQEAIQSVYILAFCVPIVISTSGLRGLLEAHQQFAVTSALRMPTAVFNYAAPLLVLPFSHSLTPVVATLACGRLITWLAHVFYCGKIVPDLRGKAIWQRQAVRPLFQFGGWMTVSNVVGPLMVTLDRFMIAGLVSVTAVAYYATPFDMITKMWLVPTALVGVMFPAFTMTFLQDSARTALLYERTIKLLLFCLFPVAVSVVVLANDGLRLWLGHDFAEHSTRVLQLLAVGVFINCLAQAPFALIQGVGRPDLTAKLHLLELPGYILALWYLSRKYGINGTAVAWTARVSIDALVLFLLSNRFLPNGTHPAARTTSVAVASLVVSLFAFQMQGLAAKVFFLFLTLSAFVLVNWFVVFSSQERKLIHEWQSRTQESL